MSFPCVEHEVTLFEGVKNFLRPKRMTRGVDAHATDIIGSSDYLIIRGNAYCDLSDS